MGDHADVVVIVVRLLAMTLLLLSAGPTRAETMVTGIVFCDQCKDGERSFFDYPLSGARVAVSCEGSGGAAEVYQEQDTNWFGAYAMSFDGSPDLSGCYARVVAGPSRCGAAAGPAQGLTLVLSLFGMAMYTAQPLLCQPEEPGGFCPGATPPAIPAPALPLPWPCPPSPLLPSARRIPFLEPSACAYDKWMMPRYRCYWKVVSPETEVAVAFGPLAAGRYGLDMNLRDALRGRGDTYRALLREATAALLNSYHTVRFAYPTAAVVHCFNQALLGTSEAARMAALRFRRANNGGGPAGNGTACSFTPCS